MVRVSYFSTMSLSCFSSERRGWFFFCDLSVFFLSFRYGSAAQSVMLPNLGSDLPTGDNGSLVILSWLALGSGKIFMK